MTGEGPGTNPEHAPAVSLKLAAGLFLCQLLALGYAMSCAHEYRTRVRVPAPCVAAASVSTSTRSVSVRAWGLRGTTHGRDAA